MLTTPRDVKTSPATSLRCPVCAQESNCQAIERWEPYVLYHCPACDVVFSDPMKAATPEFYANPGSHGCESLDRIYRERNLLHKGWENLAHNSRLFLRIRPASGGRLLDVGCGEGLFLHFAQQSYDVTGIDIDGEAVETARKMYGLRQVYPVSLKEFGMTFSGPRFDVITMFEVLEHLDNPVEQFEVIDRLLVPNGVLVISVPNRERKSFESDKLGIADYPPNHLTRWNDVALRNFLESQGFDVVTLYHRRSDWYGFYESEDILPYRLRSVLDPVVRAFQEKECVDYSMGKKRVLYKDSPVSRAIKMTVKRTSSLLWFPLYLPFLISRQPSYGLWTLSVRKGS